MPEEFVINVIFAQILFKELRGFCRGLIDEVRKGKGLLRPPF